MVILMDTDVNTTFNQCRICGCTSTHGCPAGCDWIEPDLCSSCAGWEEALEALVAAVRAAVIDFEMATGETIESLRPMWQPDGDNYRLDIDVELQDLELETE
jgi:hypothetical protein